MVNTHEFILDLKRIHKVLVARLIVMLNFLVQRLVEKPSLTILYYWIVKRLKQESSACLTL